MQLPQINSESLKKIKLRYVLLGLVLLLLVIGGAVGLYLVSRPQEIRQQAAGYASCAGGVPSGGYACAGFRQPARCNNGAFEMMAACSSSQVCDAGASNASKCVATQRSCAGGVAHGQTACKDLRTQVTCQDGVFVNEQSCNANVTCSSGRCGGGPAGTSSPTPRPSATPGTGGGGDVCQGTTCSSQPGGCIAIHQCDQLDSNGHCTVLNPQVTTGTVNAQQIANQSCKCVQVDVLTGGSNSCVNGHINNDYSTLVSAVVVCPNVACTPPTPTTPPGSSPQPSVPPGTSPQPSPTPGVSPSPVASPTPGVTPSPVVSPTPGVSPSPTPIVCGSSCSTTSECPQDHTCNNGTCQLTACVNGAACTTDQCRVTACGSSCSTTSECPNDHSCNNGTCKLNACVNGASCSGDQCRVTACGSTCSTNADCPNDHTCNGGTCKLTACVNGANCDSNQCSIVNPSPVASPVLGCNDTCVNNSDCKSASQICVDTTSGRRCRLETNITSDTCTPAGQAVAQGQPSPQPQQPTSLPVAGSADVLKAMGVGALAIILGIVGFLAL
ncbi:hypothetical protein H3C66_01655 [Patescibacteria group bacterium]|nr:hypothetical protein [Patescibacteria group bacterium]